MRRTIFLMLLVFLLIVKAGWSQESTGSIEGRILDAQGEAIALVDVLISSPSLQGVRKTKTDERGYFRALSLPVGSYSIKISHAVFQGVTYENVPIRLGKTTTLGEVHLEQQVEDMHEIVVTADKPVIDPISTTLGTNLERETYENLPVERNFRSIIFLTPQANQSYYGDEVNISGSTGLENAYFIDGINVTDPMRAATSSNLPYNFVKEIEIKTGGYQAEFGRALGGIVNVITHTGGNEIHGQLFGFFTNHRFAGKYRAGTVREKIDTFATYDFGLSIGGPLVRDKLWFFLAYNPNFEDKDVEIPGLGLHQDRKRSHLFAGKLTWQVTANTNIVFTVLGDPSTRKRIGSTYSDLLPVPNSLSNPDPYLGEIKEGGFNLSLHGRHIVNDNSFLEASISRLDRNEDDVPATERGIEEPFFADFLSGIYSGGYGRVWKDHSFRTIAKISGSLFLDTHMLKAGIEYEDNSVDDTFLNMAGPDGQQPSVILRFDESFYYTVWSTKRINVHNRVLSFFAQDSWLVSKRLRINGGLRWDGQFLVGSDGKIAQRITNQWQPRIGFTLQLGELGSQKMFGSYGRFYEQIPLVFSTFMHANSIYHEIYFDHDPRIDPEGGNVVDTSFQKEPEVSGLEGQHFDEFILGYERRIGEDFRIGIRGIYRNLRQVIEDGYVIETMRYELGNPGKGDLSFLPKFKRQYTALEFTLEKTPIGNFNFSVSYVFSRSYGNYPGLFDSDGGWSNPNFSPLDFAEQMINGTGLLPNDRTHAFKFFGSYSFSFGLSLGTYFALQSGTPLNEYGTFKILGAIIHLRERGTAGRTPTTWDLNIRLKYDLGKLTGTFFRPKLIVDVFHLFSQREAITYDQLHYFSQDEQGNPVGENPNCLVPTLYQPPITLRLGIEVDF